jgi:hypothetical protein
MARRRPAEPSVNPARGAALVVVAVLIGLFLLREGLDTSEAVTTNSSDKGSDSADSGNGSDGSDQGEESTTTTVATRAPEDVPRSCSTTRAWRVRPARTATRSPPPATSSRTRTGANAEAEGDAACHDHLLRAGLRGRSGCRGCRDRGTATVVPTELPPHRPARSLAASVVVVLGTTSPAWRLRLVAPAAPPAPLRPTSRRFRRSGSC